MSKLPSIAHLSQVIPGSKHQAPKPKPHRQRAADGSDCCGFQVHKAMCVQRECCGCMTSTLLLVGELQVGVQRMPPFSQGCVLIVVRTERCELSSPNPRTDHRRRETHGSPASCPVREHVYDAPELVIIFTVGSSPVEARLKSCLPQVPNPETLNAKL